MNTLYKNIRELRKANGWSQEELAKKLGYTDRSMIAKIESGAVDLAESKIMAFAKIFGVKPTTLMGWDDNANVFPGIKTDLSGIDPKEIDDAIDLYERFENLSPEKQAAFLNYLRFLQSDS